MAARAFNMTEENQKIEIFLLGAKRPLSLGGGMHTLKIVCDNDPEAIHTAIEELANDKIMTEPGAPYLQPIFMMKRFLESDIPLFTEEKVKSIQEFTDFKLHVTPPKKVMDFSKFRRYQKENNDGEKAN